MPNTLRSSRKHTLRQSRVLHARHKPREQDPPLVHNRLDALTSRLDKRVQIGNRLVDAIVLPPTDAASQKAVVGSAQRVVEARARVPSNAAVQHCLEYLGSWHPDFELEGSARSVVKFEGVLTDATHALRMRR